MSVKVKGYWRGIGARKKKRAPAKKPARYWEVESTRGASCGHVHRSIGAALSCAKRHNREARANHARLSRKQARATRVVKWEPALRKGD